jgi:hypothetical protein
MDTWPNSILKMLNHGESVRYEVHVVKAMEPEEPEKLLYGNAQNPIGNKQSGFLRGSLASITGARR